MSNALQVSSRAPSRRVNLRLFRQITHHLLKDLLRRDFDLGIHIVADAEMTHLNESFLRHRGSTDVLAFDYRDSPEDLALHGEIFICLDEAKVQATRFGTTPQEELVRYAIHGILHLLGHDDHHPAKRRKMKREENRLLRTLVTKFRLSELYTPVGGQGSRSGATGFSRPQKR